MIRPRVKGRSIQPTKISFSSSVDQFTGDFCIKDFRIVMESKFEITNLGLMNFSMVIEVHQSESGIFISQSKYASVVLKIFNISNCKVSPTLVITCLKLKQGW